VSKFIKQAYKDGEISLFEKSDRIKRDFVCVDDICEIHYEMLLKDESGIFNVGTGNPISFTDVAEIIQSNMTCEIKEIPMPKQLVGQYQRFTKANNSKLLKVIGDYKWKSVKDYVEENLNALSS
jgi:ADP-L-glycero-D-manno-heptose 6-epimerase